MPYQIDKTDGTVLVTLADGVVDNSTDLQLVGRNVAGYGEQQNENFVKLLENFARADTPPSKPQVGQLWFDKNADKLRPSVFDGVHWRNLTINQVSATEPQGQKEGDLWWDTVNNKLYVFVADGDQHVLVGPESVLGFGVTKWSSQVLTDTGGTDHPVSVGYVDGDPYMVMAATAFEIDQTETPLVGFTRIGEGITAKGTNVDGVTSATTRFFGTATDADRLGGRLASTWANRNDNEVITGSWSFQNDTGITLGDSLELSIKIINANEPSIFAEFGDQLNLGVDYSGSGADKTVIYIKDKNVLPYANNEVSLGSPSKNFRNVYAQDIYANFIGTLSGSMVGNTTGANRGPLQDSQGSTIVDPDTGLSYTINVGNSQATNGLTVVDVDALTQTPKIPVNAGTVVGRLEGVAAWVDYGVYTNQNNVLAGTNTFNGTSTFNGSSNFTNTLQGINVNLGVGRIGRGAISSPLTDPNQNIGDMLIDRVTINESKIDSPVINAGTIQNATIINGANIGKDSPAIQVKAQKFVDAVGRSVTRISNDGSFLQNSENNLVTERAIKEYVDTVFQTTGQDIQFYLDTKDMNTNDVKTQLNRLAPPENFKEGTTARILGSYYYGDLGTDAYGNPIYLKKYGSVRRTGIGYIGGRTVESSYGAVTDMINKKSATQGYEFQLSASGNVSVDSQTFATNTNQGTFSTLLQNGTITGWFVFQTALNADQADEFSTDAVEGAKVVVVRNGLVETYSSNEGLLQLLVGNVTYERAAASTWNSTVNIAGFATTVTAFTFDRTSRTSSAAWVYKGNI